MTPPIRQGRFTLAEHPSRVGQDTLIGPLTASHVLQDRYQSARSGSMLAAPAVDSGLVP